MCGWASISTMTRKTKDRNSTEVQESYIMCVIEFYKYCGLCFKHGTTHSLSSHSHSLQAAVKNYFKSLMKSLPCHRSATGNDGTCWLWEYLREGIVLLFWLAREHGISLDSLCSDLTKLTQNDLDFVRNLSYGSEQVMSVVMPWLINDISKLKE